MFLTGDVLTPVKEGDQWVEEFPLGAKLDLDGIVFSTGGGATNASVTFARAGHESEFVGQIGFDPAGQAVIADLDRDGVNFDRIVQTDKFATGYSVLLLAPNGERTILTYRGASTHYDVSTFDFSHIEADWMYISSLAGDMELLSAALDAARAHGIKVAMNPGKGELKYAQKLLDKIRGVEVLTLNKEELAMLVGEAPSDKELVLKAAEIAHYVIMTDGPNGLLATDGTKVLKAGMYEDVPVKDRTGAGDAFGSGLTAALASGASLEDAITYGSANSTSVVTMIGAKDGIIKADTELHSMDITEV